MESNTHLKLAARGIFVGMVTALAFLGTVGFDSTLWAQNPVPLINQPLVPDTVIPGGPGFILTVNGTGFVAVSTVEWNGNALTTHFVDESRLTGSVPAKDIAQNGAASVTVVNPGPGGGSSGTIFFPISAPTAIVTLGRTDFGPTGVWDIYLVTADFNGDGTPTPVIGTPYESADLIVHGDSEHHIAIGQIEIQ